MFLQGVVKDETNRGAELVDLKREEQNLSVLLNTGQYTAEENAAADAILAIADSDGAPKVDEENY